jgi:O-antigen/teichoic acid export membrane protein
MRAADQIGTSSRPDLGGVARGSAANLIGAVVIAVTTFALTVVVTRSVSKEAAGVFFSATSVFVLATAIGQLGTNTSLVYFLSRGRSLGNNGAAQRLFVTAMRPVFVAAVVIAAAMYIWADSLGRLMVSAHASEAATYIRVLSLFVPLAGIDHVALSATRGIGTMRPSVVVEQIMRPLLQLVLVWVAVRVATPVWLALGWAAAYLPAAGWAYWYWNHLRPRSSRFAAPVSPREFWTFSGPRALASIGQMAMQRFDIVLVGAMAGAPQAAVYAAATRFLVVGQMGNRSVSAAVQPRLGASLAVDDIAGTNHLYRVATGWLMLLAWPVYLTLLVSGDHLLTVFGKGYDAGRVVLLVLSAAMLFATAVGMVDMVLNMAGRTSWNLANVAVSFTVTFGLDVILIPHLGILGAAIGWACGIVASNLLAVIQVGVVIKVHPFGTPGLIAAALSTVCFAGLAQLPGLVMGRGIAAMLVGLAIAVVAYGAGVWLLRGPLQLRAFRAMRRGRRGGKGGSTSIDDTPRRDDPVPVSGPELV